MKKKLLVLCATSLLCLGSIVSLSACGGNNGPAQEESITEFNITVDKRELFVGETIQINVSILPESVSNKKVIFTSSDSSIATVSNSGLVTALKKGNVTITGKTEIGNSEKTLDFVILENTSDYANAKELSSALKKNPYTLEKAVTNEKYGLSNNSNVGVIESETTVEKYSIPNDTNVKIISLKDISLDDIKKFFPEVVEINDFYIIQTSILMARQENQSGRKVKLVFENKDYNIDTKFQVKNSGKTFNADGLTDTYFEGNNANLILNCENLSWKGLFDFKNCKNVYLNDFVLDYKVAPSLTGKVLSSDIEKNEVLLSVDKEFNSLIKILADLKSQGKEKNIRSYIEFDAITKIPSQAGNLAVDEFNGYEILGNNDDGYQLKINFKNQIVKSAKGDFATIQFAQYDASGVTVIESKNMYFENLTFHHVPGMAFTSDRTKNLYLNRFFLKLKDGSSSLMTSCADGLHFNMMSGEVSVTNSIIENSHDDALNIKHGYWYKVNNVQASSRTIEVSKITGKMDFNVGDEFVCYAEDDFTPYNPKDGKYTIKNVKETASGYILTVDDRISGSDSWNSARISLVSNTPKLTFKNNIVRNKRNRGILVQVPGAIIENNSFINVGHGSIQAASALDVFNECTVPQNYSIKNNKFINNCYLKGGTLLGDLSVFAIGNNGTVGPKDVIKNITIENNFFAENGNSAISLRGVSDSNFKNNLFYNGSKYLPSGDTYNTIFHLYNVGDVSIEGNYNENDLGKNIAGLMPQGMTMPEDINLQDNHNVNWKVNEEAGPQIDVKKSLNEINIDGNLSEWSQDGVNEIDILAYSAADGVEKSAKELESHFKINKLMITHDDKGIYFGFDVLDNKLDVKTINDFWLGDCVEIFMSTITNMPTADMQVYKNQGGVLQAAFAPTWKSTNYSTLGESRTNDKYLANKDLMKTVFNLNDNGYTGEILIPFTLAPEFKETIDKGERIDICIVIADCERNDMSLKRIQAGNVPHFVETWKTSTQRMPQYKFISK